MPETAERLLALLDAPHWKAPGSTSRTPEIPITARRTDGEAPMNLAVVDRLTEGRQALKAADRIEAEGTALALREAQAIREEQAMKTALLMGQPELVRSRAYSCCGAYTLLPRKGVVFCVNRHCGPAGVQRRWQLRDLALTRPAQPGGVRTSSSAPRDLVTAEQLVVFFAPTGRRVSLSTVRRIASIYKIPGWRLPSSPRAIFYSLSDMATAHAVHTVGRDADACEARSSGGGPACSGLGHLVFRETHMSEQDVARVKALCAACPIRELCLETALAQPVYQREGVYGGLSAAERRQLIKTRAAETA